MLSSGFLVNLKDSDRHLIIKLSLSLSTSVNDTHATSPEPTSEDDHFLRGVLFVEKAIFACPLPGKAQELSVNWAFSKIKSMSWNNMIS